MNIELVNRIKRLVIIALASDDELVESIVLKGGNAIDLAYHNDSISRTSYDLDYSILDNDFSEDVATIEQRIKNTLTQTFFENNFVLIDYKFLSKPKTKNENSDFWGGYRVEFKVIGKSSYDAHLGNTEQVRRNAIPIYPDNSNIFDVEFSKYEHVGAKAPILVDGYKIYVYTPEMIVFEKVRAICQQLPDYKNHITSFTPRARARDFYDIHYIMETHPIDPTTKENKELIINIFQAKRVPISFIKQIRTNKTIHTDNWKSVQDTISSKTELLNFDFYFNYVLEHFENITFPSDNTTSN